MGRMDLGHRGGAGGCGGSPIMSLSDVGAYDVLG